MRRISLAAVLSVAALSLGAGSAQASATPQAWGGQSHHPPLLLHDGPPSDPNTLAYREYVAIERYAAWAAAGETAYVNDCVSRSRKLYCDVSFDIPVTSSAGAIGGVIVDVVPVYAAEDGWNQAAQRYEPGAIDVQLAS